MKIAIFGTGGVGGYFGGRLAQAGHEVTFIARGRHLRAIQAEGLHIESIQGDFIIHPARATDRPETVGKVDVVLCCVKSWQVKEAAEKMAPLVGPDTRIIPLENGVDAHVTLADALGQAQVLPGLCRIISMVAGPGCIRHMGADPYIAFGSIDGRVAPRTADIGTALSGAKGMQVEVSRAILVELWKKFMLIVAWSGVGAVTRVPIGVMRSMPEIRGMMIASMHEVFDVARGLDIDMRENVFDAILTFIDALPPENTTSMQRDVMEGRPSELHEQCGAVVRYGLQAGVPTPLNRFLYHSLLALEQKARMKHSQP